jgi:hypothetical protein
MPAIRKTDKAAGLQFMQSLFEEHFNVLVAVIDKGFEIAATGFVCL